jgi:uncharacterized cupin superfamily protein
VTHVGLDVEVKLGGERTSGRVAVLEFVLGPHRLVPPHKHVSEDEVSYVLEGEVTFRVGDLIVAGRPGTCVNKPRGLFHTFWNPTDRPARILEIIVPAGLENSFRGTPDTSGRAPNVHSDEWVPELRERYGLSLVGE